MKKIVCLVLVFACALSICANAAFERVNPSIAFTMVDNRYGDIEHEGNFIMAYYSKYCSNSAKLVPKVEDYAEKNNIRAYETIYEDVGTMSVRHLIGTGVVAFPVIIVYNASNGEISAIHNETSWNVIKDFMDNAISGGGSAITIKLGSNEMKCKDKTIYLETPAKAVGGRTMVPIRAIAEALGARVEWDQATGGILVIRGTNVLELYLDKDYYLLNDVRTYLDVSPFAENGRTLVPLRVLSEAMGCRVNWNQATQTVSID